MRSRARPVVHVDCHPLIDHVLVDGRAVDDTADGDTADGDAAEAGEPDGSLRGGWAPDNGGWAPDKEEEA